MTSQRQVELSGVPETMLWTLYNRATEAKRKDTYLTDPDCVRIFEAISYDYARHFGKPDDSHPMRSRLCDDAVRAWLATHPGGTVVELAAGLETQARRCDDGQVNWLCVDVPEAIEVRRRFLPESARCRYVGKSALDLSWFDEVDPSRGVFVTAQGLLMYFEEEQVRALFSAIFERFPGVEIFFDTIPPWFSRKTLRGFHKTKSYRAPPMPWGVARQELEPLLRGWSRRVRRVSVAPYGVARGLPGLLFRFLSALPLVGALPPLVVRIETA